MTYSDAFTEVVTLIESAQRIVGGQWKNLDVGEMVCALPDGRSGSTQAATRTGPGVPIEEQPDVLDKVLNDWTRRGYSPVRSKRPVVNGVEATRLVVKGSRTTEAGLFAEFQIADTASTVDARARCVRADFSEITGGEIATDSDVE